MEHEHLLEPLFDKAEAYGKTSYQLIKLKTIEKLVGILSTVVSRSIAIFALSIFLVFVSIGLSLWLGDILGKLYYGFFCVAGFYGIVGVVMYFFMHNWTKTQAGNLIVKQILN